MDDAIMLILVVPVTSIAFAEQIIEQYAAKVDGYEFRFDYLSSFDLVEIQRLRHKSLKPVIFTLRSKGQGGFFKSDERLRWSLIQKLCECLPDYVDLEYDVAQECFLWMKQRFPSIKMICSYHQFSAYAGGVFQPPHQAFDILKISQYCETGLQALSFLHASKHYAQYGDFVAIAMGEKAQFARVLGPVLGHCFHYVCVDESLKTGPGQLTVDDAINIYHYPHLNQNTQIFALIGHPVTYSIGHIYHNEQFTNLNHDAVYVKIDIRKEDLALALPLLHALNFLGISVTMPLKVAIAPLVASHLQAINTLKKIDDHHWGAYNTDGIGAFKAIERYQPCIKPVLILGRGGAAIAIAETFSAHGYPVYSLNPRSNHDISTYPEFGIMINTLPGKAYEQDEIIYLVKGLLKPEHTVLNIDYGTGSLFDNLANNQGCTIVPGIEMFYQQAQEQLKIWLGERITSNHISLK